MKLRTFGLAAAGVLGNVAVAGAQTAAPQAPPPEPPPAAQPPAAQPPSDPTAPSAPAQPPSAAAPTQPAKPTEPPAVAPAQPSAPSPVAPAQQGEPPQPPPPPSQQETTPPPVWAPTVGVGATTSAAPLDADRALEDDSDKEGPPLRWRGTTFTWNQAATTTLVGLGRDNIGGEDEFYGWDFTLRPKFYMVDLPKDKVTLSAEIGFQTELTDGSTVDKRETLFKDAMFGLGYTRSLWEGSGKNKGEYSTSVAMLGGIRLPTSKLSAGQGRILTTSLGPSVNQKIKLLGQKADGLNNLTIAVGLAWGHLFADSYSPTNEDLQRTRQNASGQTILSDQLSTRALKILIRR